MASVEEDGYTFQTTSVTDLPIEMLTHILEKSPLKDALSFGIANRDTFNVVSRTPNFAKRACKKEFFTKPDTRYSINRICDPDNTEFFSSTEKFCRDKAQDYLCSRVFDNWANLIPFGPDGSYTVPNGFEALIVRDYESENCPNDVRILTIPDSVRAIYGIGPKKIRDRIEKVKGMNNVEIIGMEAFLACNSLESITIPNTVTEIGGKAFSGCWGLRSVTIPNSVTKIGGQAFKGCFSLEYVTIPNSVTKIGKEAFSTCGLKSITIPNSVTNIGFLAFSNCYALESVTIPARYKSRTKLQRIFGFVLDSISSFTFK